MCREAPKVVYELEHMGMPFDRNADARFISVRLVDTLPNTEQNLFPVRVRQPTVQDTLFCTLCTKRT